MKGLSLPGVTGYSASSRANAPSGPKITEVPSTDSQGDEHDEDEESEDDDEEEESESEEEEENVQHYSGDGVRKLICQCYVNMAICHAKNNAWDKCKRNAEE